MHVHRSLFLALALVATAAGPALAIDLPGVKIDLQGLPEVITLPGGSPQPGAAPQPAATPYLHPYTEDLFRKWVAGLDEDFATLAGPRPLDEKARELEGNWRFFQSNERELRKHPAFEGAYQRMGTLMLKLAALKGAQAEAMAQKGLKDRNPNYFNGSSGIDQLLKEADRLVAFAGFKGEGDADVVAAKQALADARAKVTRSASSFSEAAAAAYRLPPEAYHGADKAQLAAVVRATWKEKYPQDQILALRFPRAGWKRDRELKQNATGWYRTDVSSLVVYVVVKQSATVATVYPAYLNKNHMQGDALTVGADTKGSGYVHEELLIKHL
ncbi:MAG: hypothetical protein VKS61_05270 [Candidatus Sericytochromatia bacterium]|nr:hypothetical protein [Candidatus Sericytochromatia bacterium]